MKYRIGEVAQLLSVSPDTVRRWVDSGQLPAERTPAGHRRLEGAAVAAFISQNQPLLEEHHGFSARNRFSGIVTGVEADRITAKVEIRSGQSRIVAILTREAVDELGLEPGVLATAVVKATNVMVERSG